MNSIFLQLQNKLKLPSPTESNESKETNITIKSKNEIHENQSFLILILLLNNYKIELIKEENEIKISMITYEETICYKINKNESEENVTKTMISILKTNKIIKTIEMNETKIKHIEINEMKMNENKIKSIGNKMKFIIQKQFDNYTCRFEINKLYLNNLILYLNDLDFIQFINIMNIKKEKKKLTIKENESFSKTKIKQITNDEMNSKEMILILILQLFDFKIELIKHKKQKRIQPLSINMIKWNDIINSFRKLCTE